MKQRPHDTPLENYQIEQYDRFILFVHSQRLHRHSVGASALVPGAFGPNVVI